MVWANQFKKMFSTQLKIEDKSSGQIAKEGLASILSAETPDIIDILLGRGTEKVVDSNTLIREVQERVSKSLDNQFLYASVTEESEEFLRSRVLANTDMAVLFIDLVGSTSMILNLPNDKLSIIFTTFAQEMAYVIQRHHGFVLKFVGDAVIGYFVDEKDSSNVANKAVACAESMLKVLKIGINPILKKNGLPELRVKIGIDHGENTVVRYGDDPDDAHVDILGPSVSMAAKIQHLAAADQIMIGKDIFSRLHSNVREYFVQLDSDSIGWNYHSVRTGEIYSVFAYKGK